MRHHMRTSRFLTRERGALFALLAIVGPGLLAGLSDDDPAGITTEPSQVPTETVSVETGMAQYRVR